MDVWLNPIFLTPKSLIVNVTWLHKMVKVTKPMHFHDATWCKALLNMRICKHADKSFHHVEGACHMYSVLASPFGCLNVQNFITFEITLERTFQAPLKPKQRLCTLVLKQSSLFFFSCFFFQAKVQCYVSTIHFSAEQQQVFKGDLKELLRAEHFSTMDSSPPALLITSFPLVPFTNDSKSALANKGLLDIFYITLNV